MGQKAFGRNVDFGVGGNPRSVRTFDREVGSSAVLSEFDCANLTDWATGDLHIGSLRQRTDVVEFDIEPRIVEQFATEATKVIREKMDTGEVFVLVAAPDARPYVRMMIERIFVNLPVLSHVEIARGVEIKPIGSIS